jgi:hypothetical protein
MVMIEEKARASAGRSSVLEIADRTPGQARSLHHVSIQASTPGFRSED